MPKTVVPVELRRLAFEESCRSVTWGFSFIWGKGHARSTIVRPENRPPADVDADWDFAWFEVERDGQVWRGLRRLAQQYGREPWTPERPPHAATGGR